MTLHHGALAAVVLLAALGCRSGDAPIAGTPSASARAPIAPAPAPSAQKPLPLLTAESWRIELPVAGFGPASVSVPLGATTPRPVLVALHGHDDRHDWQCGSWRGIAANHPFVLCPQGSPVQRKRGAEQRFSWPGPDATARELRAALGALKSRFGEHVAADGLVLAGFSLGAERAHQVARQEPKFFSRLVLVEGGFAGWTPTVASIYARGGGERVMFVCAQSACRQAAEHDVVITDRNGVEARLVFAGELGHVLDGRVTKAIRAEWDFVVAGLERWKAWQK